MRLKLFTVIFAIATALFFVACSDESDGGGLRFDGDSAYVTLNESGERLELRELTKTELAGYQIVRSDIGESESIDAALAIRRALEENVAVVELTTDWVKRAKRLRPTRLKFWSARQIGSNLRRKASCA